MRNQFRAWAQFMTLDMARLSARAAERELATSSPHEAALLDAGRFDDWLALFADDGRYWVPLQGAAQPDHASAQLARRRRPAAAARCASSG